MSKKGAIFSLGVGHFLSKWLMYPLCYYVVRYRRKVVHDNLCLAFPEKSASEIRKLEKSFYLNFTDLIVEVLIGRYIGEEDMRRFVEIENKEEIAERCKRYGGGLVMLGHFLNWEWIVDYANQLADYGVECGTVYKRLTNNFFDEFMYKTRSRRGGFLVEMNTLLRVMVSRRSAVASGGNPVFYAMLSDQRPRRNAARYQTVLLNRKVGVLAGTELLALRFHYPVYFVKLHCVSRGHYRVTPVLVYDPDTDVDIKPGVITERFARLLEDNILLDPSRWLWSHRRFAGSSPVENDKD